MSGLARQLRGLILTRVVVITSILIPILLYQLWLGQRGSPEPTPPLSPESASEVLEPPAQESVPGADRHGPPAPATTPAPGVPTEERLPTAVAPGSEIPNLDLVFLLYISAVVYLASGLYYVLLRRFPGGARWQAYFQFLVDLLLVTLVIWKLGIGVSNPFSLFYLIVIAAATILLGRQAGFTVAIFAYLVYASLVLGLTFGKIAPADGADPPEVTLTLIYNLFVHLFAFVAIALLTSALARRLERTQRELELEREDLARLQVVHRDVIESIQSGLITTDPEGTITSVNRAGIEILQGSAEDLLGTALTQTPLFEEAHWRRYSAMTRQRGGRQRAEVETKRDGTTVYIGFSLSLLHDETGREKGYILIFQDLTRWRELEEQVRIKDRMAAVGELAAGIAHEIGNPLAAISGSVQLLARSLEGDSGEHRLLEILLKESQRLDRTIKGFLRFARPKERSTVLFDVAELLAENCELLRNSPELGEQHGLEVKLDPPSVQIQADPDQVSQIFWNLARNALKAMEAGGVLEVSGHLRGESYILEVSDTGHGMSDEERANLFHPFQSFFDTGTGIGMAIVYRIVEEHGGRVSVSSRPGGGTRISVELPQIPPPPTEPGETAETGDSVEIATAVDEGASP